LNNIIRGDALIDNMPRDKKDFYLVINDGGRLQMVDLDNIQYEQ